MNGSLVASATAFTAGILAVHLQRELPPPPVLAMLALPALLPWRGRALCAMALLGGLLTVWRAQALLDVRWPAARHGETVELVGDIASLPEGSGDAVRFVLAPRDGVAPRMRVGWYRTDAAVRAGECWRFTLRMRTPHGSLNPAGFDYEGWLFRQGIGATATVRDGTRCTATAGFGVLRARQAISARVREALPDAAAAALIAALTVGDDTALTHADWDLFRATGTTHLVAISGFNVAIVATLAFFLCRWLWSALPVLCRALPAQRVGLLGAGLWAGGYALLAGFEPPVQRAFIMLLVALIALWAHRASRPSRVLASAWIAVLALDPFAVASPGFWLSFGAVAAIFYVSLGRLRRPGVWHSLVTLQVLLAVALAPVTLLFFQEASWIAPFVNLLAVPFFAVLTPWVLVAIGVHVLAPAAGLPLLQMAAFALDGFRRALEVAAQRPDLWLPAAPDPAILALAACGVLLLFAPRAVPLRPLGLLCVVPLCIGVPQTDRAALQVVALDVGQGLAVLVRTAHHALLYDAGPAFDESFDAGASVVAPYALATGTRELDLLVLSHAHRDHAGGVDAVRQLLRVRRELGTERSPPCVEGDQWHWDGVRFEVLNGPAPGLSVNDGGCVLRVATRDLSVLLPADIEARTEARLVARYGDTLRSDVLIAPHHGSRTSSTPAFVAAVRPNVVVYGAGWRNHFRHPRPDVAARYAELGARQYVTGAGGTITVERDAAGHLRVSEYRREAARFWNAPAGP